MDSPTEDVPQNEEKDAVPAERRTTMIPPPPVTDMSNLTSKSLDDGAQNDIDNAKASGLATSKKKKHITLPPPPPALDLQEFDSKFLDKKPTKQTNVSTFDTDIPPPPPPLPSRSQPKPTVVSLPPPTPAKSEEVEPVNDPATDPLPTTTNEAKKPIEIGAGTPHPSAYFEPETKSPPTTQRQEQHQQIKKQTYNRVIPPPLSHLAPRQSSLPVLLVTTVTSTDLARKNNVSLSALFNGLAKTIAPENNMPSSNIAPRLPPFRSIGKSVVLNWSQIHVRFLDEDALEVMDPSETEFELYRVCGNVVNTEEKRNRDISSNIDNDSGIPSFEQLEDILRDSIVNNDTDTEEKKQTEGDIDESHRISSVVKDTNGISAASPDQNWLRSVRHILDTCTDNLQQDLHSCPIVALLVASTNDEYYLECLKELRNVHHLPRPHQSGHYDPHSMRFFYLLLHDNVNGPADFEEGVALIQMRQAFPNQICAVLRMNSVDVSKDKGTKIWNEEAAAIWSQDGMSHIFPARNGIIKSNLPCGQALSKDDLLNIRRFIATLVADCIIPAMERRIFNLNVAVNNAKRGVKNVFKSFWRKPKDGSVGSAFDNFSSSFHGPSKASTNPSSALAIIGGGIIKYAYDQIESQMRLLADSLFLMRDYESALNIYRLAKDDYKSDRATVHYASAYEMMALCLHSMDPLGTRHNRELHAAIETSLYSYTRGAEEERFIMQQGGGGSAPTLQSVTSPAGGAKLRTTALGYCNKLATRLCLVLCSVKSLYQSRHLETADLLASASSHETPLCAAILLEQSARHYKAANMLKKYAFHLLMAGHMYRTAKVEKHSMRCFTLSHCMYDRSKWKPLYMHLETALAQQLYSLERFEVAMLLYCKLVGYKGVGRNHQKFLQNLLEVFRKNPEEALKAAERMRSGAESHNALVDPSINLTHPLREIPGMALPQVIDESLTIMIENRIGDNHEEGNGISASTDSIWQNLTCCIEAELKAAKEMAGQSLNAEEMIEKTLEKIDEEKFKIESAIKKKAKNVDNLPVTRHRKEPILVQVSVANPMDMQLNLVDVQLVASFENSNAIIFTNEFSPDKTAEDMKEKKTYNFRCSARDFETPDFAFYKGDNNASSDQESFFVVEKASVILEPNEVKRITLAICPLVEGSLRIRGMRWRLFNDLWVSHVFKTLGPLLQDTPEHRSNRVRGEPQLLNSKISHEMPFLLIETVEETNSVLQGEICKWTLRFTNVGTAPATNLVLKTNSPWISIDSDSDEGNEQGAKSNCIGPSGTLMSLPLTKASSESLNVEDSSNGVIYPGETAEVEVKVRAAGGGKRDFYLLFRYQLHDKEKETDQLRYVKKLISIAVFPSLNLTASLMPSYWKKDEHILSVEMTNYRSDQEPKVDLFLHDLSIASRFYRAVPIEGQISEELNSASKKAIQIGWQERLTMHYRIIPLDNAKFTTSNCPFLVTETSDTCQTNFDFLCLENAYTKFKIAVKKHDNEQQRRALEEQEQNQPRSISQIRRDNVVNQQEASSNMNGQEKTGDTLIDETLISHPTSIASLCPVGDDFSSISLICGWSAYANTGGETSYLNGQHYLSQLVVRPKIKKKGCPLTITSRHKSNISHDFTTGLLRTELEITVRNRLISAPVKFEFAVDRHPQFNIIGAESFIWNLDGGDELTVPFQVEISSSGIYNLQTVRLVVLSDDKEIPYVFPLQWILRVNDN